MNYYTIINLFFLIYVRNLYLKAKALFLFDVINDTTASIIFRSFEENTLCVLCTQRACIN
jgi:hypothetical protein